MKSLFFKIIFVIVVVVCFGSGAWKTLDYVEDRIIEVTVNLIEDSEFISEIRSMVKDIAEDVIKEIVSQGYKVSVENEIYADITP